jgi:uncharacterized membrane protein YfcA
LDLKGLSKRLTIKQNKIMQETIILLVIGLAAGLLSGLLGIGGGILIIPMLVGFLGYTQKDAQGTSLGLLLLPIGILAVLNYYKAGHVNIKAVGMMVITFVIGSYISSKIAINIDDNILKKIFAVFLMIYALKLLLGK